MLHTCMYVSCVTSDRFKLKTGPNKTNSITSIFQWNYQQCTDPLDSAGLLMELTSLYCQTHQHLVVFHNNKQKNKTQASEDTKNRFILLLVLLIE